MNNLKEDLLKLIDPSVNLSLKETKGLTYLNFDDEKDIIILEVLVEKEIPETENLKKEIIKTVKIKHNHKGIKLSLSEKRVHYSIVNSGIPCIGIISGKGGVGKSSVAANIAYRFNKKGYNVAVIDADIYGSSIPDLLEIGHQQPYANEEQKIIPIKKENIEVMSTEFFTQKHEPVIWRAGMLHSMLDYFFYETAWNPKTNVIIIDFPPGTGDIMLDIKQYIKNPKMLLVTTPHPAAASVATKAGIAAQKMEQDVIGIIENMSYFVDSETNKKHYIFGENGGLMAAKNLEAELIAQIPIAVPEHNLCLYDITEPVGKIFNDIVDYLIYALDIKK